MNSSPNCPSCREPMQAHQFPTNAKGVLELDICYPCQGIWLDQHESLKLTPAAVVELFSLLHQHRTEQRRPLQATMACPRCVRSLAQGFDVVRSGRYMTYRCMQRHGRFSTFSSFMVEKGFVRHLTTPEITDLAKRVEAIYCTSCGAPVDIRKDHACPYCRAAFSLIDPEAVSRALQGYAKAAMPAQGVQPANLADALISMERDRSQTGRNRQKTVAEESNSFTGDLLGAGVWLVIAALGG